MTNLVDTIGSILGVYFYSLSTFFCMLAHYYWIFKKVFDKAQGSLKKSEDLSLH